MVKPYPKITVLIPTFNRADYLAECVDSILSQTLPAAQVIVVNDGSTDHTLEVLKAYGNRIDYLETPHVGKPGAINHGLKNVTGDYLWIFDDDDVALSEALERFVEPLEKHPECGFSYSTYFFTMTQPQNKRIGSVLRESTIPDLEKRGFLIPLLEWNFLGGAALFARTSCYDLIGQFDPALLRAQDYDMAIRIARKFKGVRVPGSATFHYRQHQGIRGNLRDRFHAKFQRAKWLEYDQIFFRRLYRELSLSDFLPPNISSDNRKRQALLQRLTVMAAKLLMQEALDDLRELARLPDQDPFTEEERLIVKVMIESPYYGEGNLLDRRELRDEMRRLSASSKTIRFLRKEILRASLSECKKNRHPRLVFGLFRRLFFLAW